MSDKDWDLINTTIMVGVILGVIVGIVWNVLAYGPKTEAIIPIGQSPGLSGVCTTLGTYHGIDIIAGILYVAIDTPTGVIYEPVAQNTDVWLNGKTPLDGLLNIKEGAKIEVNGIACCMLHAEKYPDATDPCITWIKLEDR